jgi:hypothetical protein
MAIIIKAPNEILSLENINNTKLFLAGGITNVEDWQSKVCEELKDINDLTIYNPRRDNFDTSNPNVQEEQMIWEFNHLRDANILMFWFSYETLQPITLYELGMWANGRLFHGEKPRTVWIGIHPSYKRKEDVIIQTKLVAPYTKFWNNLDEMILNIESDLENYIDW